MSKARRFKRLPKKRLRKEELLQMETNEQAQRERYREVERA